MRLVLSLLLILPALAFGSAADESQELRERVEQHTKELRANLAKLKALMDEPETKASLHATWEVQQSMQQSIDRIEDLARRILPPFDPEVDCREPEAPKVVVHKRAPRPVGPVAMGPGRFADLTASVTEEPFDSGKMRLLRTGTEGQSLNTAQIIGLMQPFTMDKDKVDVAVMLFPRCVDPEQWYKVHGALSFESSKTALRNATR